MGLSGSLTELPFADLIEMTSLGGKTGLLVLSDDKGAVVGKLAFRAGLLVGATCGELSAEKAFYALLALSEGTFDFDPDAELDEGICNLHTESLLMEGMRRLDEIRRLRRLFPAPARVRLIGGEAQDAMEARVLGYLGPGARSVGDIIDGLLVGGEADEYDALMALQRLTTRGVTRVELPVSADDEARFVSKSPQPELER
jgi:hypothetical protein